MTAKLTNVQYIKKARKIHGNKYSYKKLIYTKYENDITITCPIHGDFIIPACEHVSKGIKNHKPRGCKKCEIDKQVEKCTKKFIKLSKLIHGDIYDYSKSKIRKIVNKVIIICPIHGEFEMIAENHFKNKIGCKKCYLEKIKQNLIKEFNLVHKNKFLYPDFKYKSVSQRIKIICPIHGIFFQSIINHLKSKYGCEKCKTLDTVLKKAEFIKRCEKLHNYKYDYSNVVIKNVKTPVKIICPIHGEFRQTPDGHMAKKGCQHCNESKGELEIAKYLKYNKIKFIRQYKFENCKHKRILFFDFYLPKYNICIEYQGPQHYKSIEYFGGKSALRSTRIRDSIKKKFCSNNKIKLICISHKKFNNIHKILKTKIH
jgi:hypothetical protein